MPTTKGDLSTSTIAFAAQDRMRAARRMSLFCGIAVLGAGSLSGRAQTAANVDAAFPADSCNELPLLTIAVSSQGIIATAGSVVPNRRAVDRLDGAARSNISTRVNHKSIFCVYIRLVSDCDLGV